MTLFRPQPRVIKQRIERLIEQAYLKRDENDKTVLNYMA
jgi:hypothetical protein